MIYSIVYSNRAVDTFEAISDQINERWGIKYVIEFERLVLKTIETIKTTPFIFEAIDGNPNVRKGFIHKNCSMFYELDNECIKILFFWDNRQEPIF